jgi:hypothetical protein
MLDVLFEIRERRIDIGSPHQTGLQTAHLRDRSIARSDPQSRIEADQLGDEARQRRKDSGKDRGVDNS